jgi:hypothetical protein
MILKNNSKQINGNNQTNSSLTKTHKKQKNSDSPMIPIHLTITELTSSHPPTDTIEIVDVPHQLILY